LEIIPLEFAPYLIQKWRFFEPGQAEDLFEVLSVMFHEDPTVREIQMQPATLDHEGYVAVIWRSKEGAVRAQAVRALLDQFVELKIRAIVDALKLANQASTTTAT
jgi:hypothetical protein